MKLKELYSLRNEFTIIGVTGKLGGGSSQFSKIISSSKFIEKMEINQLALSPIKADDIKVQMCYEYLKYEKNFQKYTIIDYWSVLIFHLLYESIHVEDGRKNSIDCAVKELVNIICQYKGNKSYKNRYEGNEDFSIITSHLLENRDWYEFMSNIEKKTAGSVVDNLHKYLRNKKEDPKLFEKYLAFQKVLSKKIENELFKINPTKRSRLFHDLGINLRSFGSVRYSKVNSDIHIYTVAKTINYLIKSIRSYTKENNFKTKVVIDSLKNSLELCYFKEKFSAFYMISVNKYEANRMAYLKNKVKEEFHLTKIVKLGESEYLGDDFKNGKLSSPDIENCIQKAEYHINLDNLIVAKKNILKLLALIERPGLITPTAIERCMQIAFNAKLNSGCISRQVGAIVTDKDFVIKSLGWNDAAKEQMPCTLRSAQDLINDRNTELFSKFELEGEVKEERNTFKELLKEDLSPISNIDTKLQGRKCSFCFKSHLNEYEGEKNQVHTRSLHAEENAMMQIAKNGGEGLANGILFTTASPCELCSKKSYQLGIKTIYYIDPYPGIATTHILKSGVKKNDTDNPDPTLIMFEGAIGRTFHKLYEPIMPIKDELAIIADVKPRKEGRGLNKKTKKLLDTIGDEALSNFLKDKLQNISKEQFIIYLKDNLMK